MENKPSKKSFLSVLTALFLAAGLLITAGGQAPSAAAASTTISHFVQPPFDYYKISRNDTLYFIGKRYGVSVDKLFQLNPGINAYNLQPGQILKLRDVASPQPPASSPNASIGDFEQQVFDIVNQERANNGLSPLRLDAKLSAMAKDKAIDMYTNNYFDHNSPTYGSPFDMMRSYGISFSYAGENIAKGQRTPQEVMNAWMNSPGHRANILNPNYNTIGVAYYKGEWVQEFIRA